MPPDRAALRRKINESFAASLDYLAHHPHFNPGDLALIRGSFEEVTVVAQSGHNVLVKRAGGQMAYDADELEPYDPDFCPLP